MSIGENNVAFFQTVSCEQNNDIFMWRQNHTRTNLKV